MTRTDTFLHLTELTVQEQMKTMDKFITIQYDVCSEGKMLIQWENKEGITGSDADGQAGQLVEFGMETQWNELSPDRRLRVPRKPVRT